MVAPTRTDKTTTEVTFPIREPFTGSGTVNPNWTFDGAAKLTGGSDGSLQLTPDENNKAGTAFLDQPFSSKLGVSIEFDYACEGNSSNFGDGFCLYLIDGSKTTGAGAYGAALGYSTMNAGPGNVKPGVTAGYVGVGFDNYGNYRSNLAGPGGEGSQPYTLGVRGSGNRADAGSFRWLTGEKVDGGFRSTWDDRTHVQISIVDGKLTVHHTRGSDRKLVIDQFDLTKASGQVPMPPTFKLGLSASTGGARAAHRIRNLVVALPADMPLSMEGPKKATVGDKVSYTIEVGNNGPNDVPDAEVIVDLPAELSGVTVDCEPKERCLGSSTDHGVRQLLDLPKGTSAKVTVHGTVASAAGGRTILCASEVKSATRSNTATKQTGEVSTDVLRGPVGGHVPARTGDPSWKQGGDTGILFVEVDTSKAGFTETPIYVASVACTQYGANLGVAGIYGRDKDRFQVGLRWHNGGDLSVADAVADGFRLDWIACPRDVEGAACGQTSPQDWRQGDDTRIVLVDVEFDTAFPGDMPVIVATAVGDKYTANLGTVAVFNQSTKGFTAGIRLSNQSNLTPEDARSSGYRINWIAAPKGSGLLVAGRTDPGTWTQGQDSGIVFGKAATEQENLPDDPAFVATVAGLPKVVELRSPAIYNASRKGFSAGVRRSDSTALPPKFMSDNQIAANWISCPPPPA